MASQSILAPGQSRADKQFNFGACLIDAVGWPLGIAFFSQTTLLPVFLRHLKADNLTVGALPAVYNLLVFLPGLLVIRPLNKLPRARGWLIWIALAERVALLPLVPLTLMWGMTHKIWLLAAVFACLAGHALAMGLNQPAYWVVVGKVVPTVWRGRLYGYAGGIAGVLGFGVERGLHVLLGGPNGGFPDGFAWCFLIGFVILTVSVLPLGFVREPFGTSSEAADSHSGHYGRDSLRVWRTNHDFRRFLYAQIVFMLAALATPFYILYAQKSLHADAASVARDTALLVLAATFGSLGWGAWADKAGNRIVLLASVLCAVAASILALLAPSALVFSGVFALAGLAAAGIGLAGNNIVMEYAGTPRDIPLYSALYNAVTAVPRAVAPLLGGLLADLSGYPAVFVCAALLSLASLILTRRAGEPRHAP